MQTFLVSEQPYRRLHCIMITQWNKAQKRLWDWLELLKAVLHCFFSSRMVLWITVTFIWSFGQTFCDPQLRKKPHQMNIITDKMECFPIVPASVSTSWRSDFHKNGNRKDSHPMSCLCFRSEFPVTGIWWYGNNSTPKWISSNRTS